MKRPTDFIAAESDSLAASMFSIAESDALILKHAIDSKGQLRLYSPAVQKVLLDLIKKPLLEALKAEEKKAKDAADARRKSAAKSAADVAKAMTEEDED